MTDSIIDRNYFPNFTCGSCSANLAYSSGDYSLQDIIEKCCKNCNLYSLGVKKLSNDMLIYKNIFIEELHRKPGLLEYKIVSRNIIFNDIVQATEWIDKEIKS